NAAQSTSGAGTVTVTTANSLNGTSMIFDISDATGSPLVISGFDAVTAGDAYFLSGASVDTTLEDEVGAVEMVNDSAAVTQNGMIANAQSLPQLDDSFAARNFDLRLAGDAIEVVAVNGAEMTDVSASGSSLAKQRYRLSNMPGEDLIMLVSNDGARRVSLQYDMLPEAIAKVQREINIRVTDASEGTVEMFDVATGTSLATRTLDEEQRVSALEFDIAFTGVLQDDDAFLIGDNAAGIGDNRNIDRLLQLQTKDIFGTGSGGFQKVFSSTVAKLGAIVQSGGIAAKAAEALRDVSLEAESTYTGVNLDTEAANLIEQQQAYQASARVLATARELFDTLIKNL
ncbi:MAG: flagellar basal body rod C-terminal domain-containing protein, partial [Pseudomonadota bacterium]|nr:flagellar basal body rod C-terminal domain-containing protein [Pseudomonadota bacterium]